MGVDGDVKVGESVVTHMLSILFQHFHGVIFVLFAHMSRTPINTSLQSSWRTDRLVQGMPTYQSLVWVCVFTPAVRKTDGLPDVIKKCVEKGVVCVSEDKTGLEWHTSRREVLWEGDGVICKARAAIRVWVGMCLCVWERKIDIVMYHDCKLLCKVTRAIPLPFLA